jgi:CRP/FNR family transcriptional regulator, cyclic AMP receptor protein
MAAPVELIRSVPLFEGIEGRELQQLAASFKERQFDEGAVIAVEGEGGVGFFVIGEGEASVLVHGEERHKMKAGDYFGEIALIDSGARTATVKAITPLKAYGLTAWDFRPLVEDNAAIAWRLLERLAKFYRESQRSG